MAMRVTGMYSGLDTESMIQELVAVRKTKVDTLKKSQIKLQWKQDAWKTLNDKIYKLQTGTLDNLKYEGALNKKITTSSNSNAVSVESNGEAMNSVQSLKILELAKYGFLTGGDITDVDGKRVSSGSKLVEKLGIAAGSKFEVATGNKKTEIVIDENTTISDLVTKLNAAGVKANFDSANQKLFIGSTDSGKAKDFTITASNSDGTNALNKLGILVYDDSTKALYQKYVDMATDPTAKQKEVDSEIAKLLKKYQSRANTLKGYVEKIDTAQTNLVKDYKENYGDTVDIEDETARNTRKTELEDKIKLLEEKDSLTEDEKVELKKMKGELSYVTAYNTNLANKTKYETELNGIYQPDADGNVYLNADGTAGERLNKDAAAFVQEKIDEAVDIINNYSSLTGSAGVKKTLGSDAKIDLNGAIFTSTTNTVNVNGLSITCKTETGSEVITLTTKNDSSGMYDTIKGFLKEYNSIINEMDKLYNAESSKGYDVLLSEEKEALTDSEVEEWEKKIKDSLLRKDSNLSTVSSALKQVMSSGYNVNGKTMYLSDFGIETLGYFNAVDNEKNAYYINGDKDTDSVKDKDNDLLDMINNDPNAVTSFFNQLTRTMFDKTKEIMTPNESYRSSNKVYDDKKMKSDYDSYTKKIADAEKKLKEYEDKWYKKFSVMETAMAKLQSNSNAIAGLLGGG